MRTLICSLLLLAALPASLSAQSKQTPPAKHTFEIKDGAFVLDGKPTAIYSGEMHFARIPKTYWRHRLQMIKAMGLNAVATYVFWNYHETVPGVWDFRSESRDIAEFIRIAQQEGLWVILRPGPYACAEWEFGGYPWWLQNNPELVLRSNNPAFLAACKTYIDKLAEQTRDLQITRGGPIIMVQAENEFGSYVAQRKDVPLEQHKAYSGAIVNQLKAAGFEVPMFTSDGTWLFEGGSVEGILPTGNGENSVENLKKLVNQYHGGQGPYMVAEFYSGWLDHWAEPFQKVKAESLVSQMKKFVDGGVSFNVYMVHGGTNFAFTSGANYDKNHDIQPDLTSYDYDAPISEAGWATPKYAAMRDYLKSVVPYTVPEVPAPMPVIEIPSIELSTAVSYDGLLTDAEEFDTPKTFEQLNQGHGYVLYRRHFNQPISGTLEIPGLRDYALVYVNGERVGELNRYYKRYTCAVDIPFNATLEILVENMGRINYGAEIVRNTKGIISPVSIDGHEIAGPWEHVRLPMDRLSAEGVGTPYTAGRPVVYAGSFSLKQVGDTFLDMSDWEKGIVFVNGHNLGRYWSVGPQQTLYLPGCWLNKGKNEVVIFEMKNSKRHTSLRALKTPILETLKPE